MIANKAPPSHNNSKKITCEECKFWAYEYENIGRCHRTAPVPKSDLRYRDTCCSFPITKNDCWCGEAEKK